MSTPLDIAREVVRDEAAALARAAEALDSTFERAIETIGAARRVVVTGLGKSGVIAQKIAATLTSTGTPAWFMHPVEALHGDVGNVASQDCLLALSRSGATEEVLRFVMHFRRLGGPVIGITQGRESRLAELSRHTILLPDAPEAGPLNLAPTTSCVLQLAIGDAIAMALLHARGFAAEDFAQYHPEGALGRRLLMRAEDLMHAGAQLPLVSEDQTFDQLVCEMTRRQLGVALVVHRDGRLLGTFTDGDLRRLFERVDNPRRLPAREAFEHSRRAPGEPRVRVSTVGPATPAVACLAMMRESQITHLVVVDSTERPVGLLRLMDLMTAGLG